MVGFIAHMQYVNHPLTGLSIHPLLHNPQKELVGFSPSLKKIEFSLVNFIINAVVFGFMKSCGYY